jgi:branched-chain amino acid transport system ATP-binding protein
MVLLFIESLHSGYGDFKVIQNVTFRVNQGQAVGIVGPNGHGKSTLLKTICGLLKPSSGKVFFEDHEITGMDAADIVSRGLVYVAEDRRLFNDMSVQENLMLGAFLTRAKKHRARNFELVHELFPRLAERRNQRAGSLSGGEAQMLAMGRGLMTAPAFLALDEPSLGLSPKLTVSLMEAVVKINRAGIGVLLVEQSLDLIRPYLDAIWSIEEGELTPERIENSDKKAGG